MTTERTLTGRITEAVQEAFGMLANVGESEEFEVDGWHITVKIESDEERTILDQIQEDYDECVWGRLEWGDRASTGEYDRPSDFDGNAERIDRYHPGVSQGDYVGLWWQPPKAGPLRGTPEFDQLRRDLCDLLTYGFAGVVVEVRRASLTEPCPTCGAGGSTIETGYSALWGIEAFAGEYFLAVAAECIAEAIASAS